MRPFNCVGVGEARALGDVEVLSGNVKLAMSHVVPDLVQKVLKGQDPLHILGDGSQIRHYTYGGDLARGIVTAMEHPDALQRRLQPLDRAVDHRARARRADLAARSGAPTCRSATCPTTPFEHDVQTPRARDREGQATSSASRRRRSLDEMLDEVIPWIEDAVADGRI